MTVYGGASCQKISGQNNMFWFATVRDLHALLAFFEQLQMLQAVPTDTGAGYQKRRQEDLTTPTSDLETSTSRLRYLFAGINDVNESQLSILYNHGLGTTDFTFPFQAIDHVGPH